MSNRSQLKSQKLQFVLALLLGPLGLFYSSTPAAVLLAIGAAWLAKDTDGYGALLAWPVALAVGVFTVHHWNRRAAEHRGGQGPERDGGAPLIGDGALHQR